MDEEPRSPSHVRPDGRRRVPLPAIAGAAAILAGLLADVAAHAGLLGGHEALLGGFAVAEHVAHLAVFIGMALVLAGVVADGVVISRRQGRRKGVLRHAVR